MFITELQLHNMNDILSQRNFVAAVLYNMIFWLILFVEASLWEWCRTVQIFFGKMMMSPIFILSWQLGFLFI